MLTCIHFLPSIDGNYNDGLARHFTFDSNTSIIDVPVSIAGHSIFELTDTLNATLSFPAVPIPRVTLAPVSAQVTVNVLDDDEYGQFIAVI